MGGDRVRGGERERDRERRRLELRDILDGDGLKVCSVMGKGRL